MKSFYKILFLIFSVSNLYSNGIIDTLSQGSYNIGNSTIVNYFKNIDTNYFTIMSVKLSSDLSIDNQSDDNGIIDLKFKLNTIQNLKYTGFAFIKVKDKNSNEFSFPVLINVEPHYNDNYDIYTYNKSGKELIDSLRTNMNSKYVSYTYKVAREKMFGYVDNYNGSVECIYTGRMLETSGIPDVNVTHFNTEHTWAQSFGAENEPEKSDLFHLRPSYEEPNSKRANYPFGYVIGTATYSDSGSSLGTGKNGNTVFEIRDKFKGDIARGMFYFALKYGDKSYVDMNFLAQQYDDLYAWYYFDPVDQIEMERNSRIEESQKIRNPFIDHPEFIERLNLLGDYTYKKILICSDENLKFSFVGDLNLFFYSNRESKLEYANLSDENAGQYSLIISDSIMKSGSMYNIPVTNLKTENSVSNVLLKVKFVDSEEFDITLNTIGNSTVTDNITQKMFILYPNPVINNKINIKVNNKAFLYQTCDIEIHTIDGKNVYKNRGIINSDLISIDSDNIKKYGKEFVISFSINGNNYNEKFIIK